MRGSAARGLLPALLVLGLVAVVAVAASGSTERGTDRIRPPSATLLDAILTLGFLGVLAGAGLFLYAFTQPKLMSRELAKHHKRTRFLSFVLVMGVFTAVAYYRIRTWKREPAESEGVSDALRPGAGQPPDAGPAETTVYEPGLSWPAIAGVCGLVLAGIAAYALARRRARTGPGEETLAAQLAGALEGSLDDLRTEADARRAVIAAYARLENVLAAHGVPRRVAETAEEYLARVLGDLEVDPRSVQRLTELFSRAKFSPHEIDATMKEDAIVALETVRDELRLAREAPAEAPATPSAAAGAAS